MAIYICEFCNKEYQAKPSQAKLRKHCSRACDADSKIKKRMDELEEFIGVPLIPWLKEKYEVEKWAYRDIQRALGMPDNSRLIKRMLEMAGLGPRTASEAVKLQHQKNPERAKQMSEQMKSPEFKRLRAIGNQNFPKISSLQRAAISLVEYFGLEYIPEYAVDIYNIDIAIVNKKIAIEIDGGNWHESEKKSKEDESKEKYLSSDGWEIKRFKADEFGKLIDFLKSM